MEKYLKSYSIDSVESMIFYEINELNYNDLLSLWIIFKEKYYYNKNNTFDNFIASMKLTLKNNDFSIIIDNVYNNFLLTGKDELLLIYIKNSNQLLYICKSFYSLLGQDKIKLPFYEKIDNNIHIQHKTDLYKYFNKLFKKDENIIIAKLSK